MVREVREELKHLHYRLFEYFFIIFRDLEKKKQDVCK